MTQYKDKVDQPTQTQSPGEVATRYKDDTARTQKRGQALETSHYIQ